MELDWLHEQSTWKIVLALVATMLATAELGFRAGQRRHTLTGDTGRGHFGAVQASLLGLLALLLGFTFNMSNQRYEARRQLVVDDANAIQALDLRSECLPEPRRVQFHQLLKKYMDIRADPAALKPGITAGELQSRINQAEALHRQMRELVNAEVQSEHPAKGADSLVALLGDALAIQNRRINAYQNRVPDTILLLLFGAASTAAAAVGYSGGLGKHHGILAATMLTFLVGATVYTILDLDQPRQGLIQVEQKPLLRLKERLDREQ
jgi:hypothetical protein